MSETPCFNVFSEFGGVWADRVWELKVTLRQKITSKDSQGWRGRRVSLVGQGVV